MGVGWGGLGEFNSLVGGTCVRSEPTGQLLVVNNTEMVEPPEIPPIYLD